jgi:hypothetical protein
VLHYSGSHAPARAIATSDRIGSAESADPDADVGCFRTRSAPTCGARDRPNGSTDDIHDFSGEKEVSVKWVIETKSFAFGKPTERKRLEGTDLWADQMLGRAQITAYWKSDEQACWNGWAVWSDCAKERDCLMDTEPCESDSSEQVPAITNYQRQKRTRFALGTPLDQLDSEDGSMAREGFEFQLRLENMGRFRIKRIQLVAEMLPEDLMGDISHTTPLTPDQNDCPTGTCSEVECCPPDDYTYEIEADEPSIP